MFLLTLINLLLIIFHSSFEKWANLVYYQIVTSKVIYVDIFTIVLFMCMICMNIVIYMLYKYMYTTGMIYHMCIYDIFMNFHEYIINTHMMKKLLLHMIFMNHTLVTIRSRWYALRTHMRNHLHLQWTHFSCSFAVLITCMNCRCLFIQNDHRINSVYGIVYILHLVKYIYNTIHTTIPMNVLYDITYMFSWVKSVCGAHVFNGLHSVHIDFCADETERWMAKIKDYSSHNACNYDINKGDFIYSNYMNSNTCYYALMTGKRKFSRIKSNNKCVKFIVDSGCSNHLTNVDMKYMFHVEPIHTLIGTAGDHSLRSTNKGCLGPLKHVLHTPSSKFSLLSVSNICDEDITVVFTRDKVCFYNNEDVNGYLHVARIMSEGYREGNLYLMDISTETSVAQSEHTGTDHFSLVASAVIMNRYTMWHQRLNHIGHDSLRRLRDSGVYHDMIWDEDEYVAHRSKICHGCASGKLTAAPTRKVSGELIDDRHPSSRPGGLILIDLFFSNITSYNSSELGLIIVDAYSKCMWVTFGRSKDEAQTMFSSWLELMRGHKFHIGGIGKVRSDNGGEFVSSNFMNMLSVNGIVPERAPPYAHVNRAERAIRHVKETARAYINTNYINLSRLAAWRTKGRTSNPFIFWNEAVRHACHVFNVIPEKKFSSKGISRHERFFGSKPDMTRLKVFGSTGYVHISRELRKSFDSTSVMGVYMGFNPLSPQTWRMMNLVTGSVVESRTVIFNENVDEQNVPVFIRGGGVRSSQEDVPDEYWQDSAEYDDPEADRLPSRWDTVDAVESSYVATVNDKLSEGIVCVQPQMDCGASVRVPKTVREARNSPEWSDAYDREIQSFVKNDILEFVPRQDSMKVLSWRWIFRVKENTVSGVLTHKARGTLRGDHQIEGVDYQETFAPVARLKSLRLLLSIVCDHDLECDNMDVDTAFLYGEKQDDEPEVYVQIPHGFPIPPSIQRSSVPHVGRLKRHVYGLKQAPRTWFRTLSEYLVVIGFVPCVHDPCLFVRRSTNKVCYIFVYVDDLVIAADSVEEMRVVKDELRDKWSMKDLGPIESILGIRVIRNRTERTLSMTQEKYIDNLLSKFNLSDVKPTKTPLDPGCSLSKQMCPVTEEERALASKQPYRELVGSLMYLMVCTRPDIAFAICQLSRYSSNHGAGHWSALMHVVRYVKGTKSLGITYRGNSGLYPTLFSDASFASDIDSRRSVSGYISYVGGGPVSWRSKLQSTTALSTCESEYIALCSAAQEAVHLRSLFQELIPSVDGSAVGAPIVVFEDNKATIDISKNPCLHEKQKHVDVKYHYVRECVLNQRIRVQYVRTDLMLADILTKAVQTGVWMRLISRVMGPTNISDHVDEK